MEPVVFNHVLTKQFIPLKMSFQYSWLVALARLTSTGEFEAAIFILVTVLLDVTSTDDAIGAGETLKREAWRNKTEFT